MENKLTDALIQQMRPLSSINKILKKKKPTPSNSTIPVKPKKKKIKKVKKTKRKKLPSIKSLKRKADKLFSLFIRNRDKVCFLKSKDCKGAIQCGHLIKRSKMATRYDELNCHALCEYHNYLDNFEHDLYVARFIEKYGSEAYLRLVKKSRRLVKANRLFFEKIIKKYERLNNYFTPNIETATRRRCCL